MSANGAGSLSLLANAVEFLQHQEQEHEQEQQREPSQFQQSIDQYEDEMKQQLEYHRNQIQRLNSLLEIMGAKFAQLKNQHKELIDLVQQKQSQIQQAHQLKQQSLNLQQQIMDLQEKDQQLRHQLLVYACDVVPEDVFEQMQQQEQVTEQTQAAGQEEAPALVLEPEFVHRSEEFSLRSMSPLVCARKLRSFLRCFANENNSGIWIIQSADLQDRFQCYARFKVTPQCFGRAINMLGYGSYTRRLSGDSVKCYNFEGKRQLLQNMDREVLDNLLAPN